MSYTLDPRIHRVWRTPDVLQFGVDVPVLVLSGVSNADERMLVALDAGVTLSGLRLVAERAGAPTGSAEEFLRRVAPVLVPGARAVDPRIRPAAAATVALDGSGPTAVQLSHILRESGLRVAETAEVSSARSALDSVNAAVVVGSFALRPERHQRWLRQDIPHLAVVLSDSTATVGPFVEPGFGPCLGCVERARVAENPDWLAMACQLAGRASGRETGLVSSAVAAVAARAVANRLAYGPGRLTDSSLTIDHATGRVTRRNHEPDAQCGCIGLPDGPI
jgi:bacteriocin biosynthesis cyclodehydratase domain-containing protein